MYVMLSHIECSAGGSHTFDNHYGDCGDTEIVIVAGCSKCNEVWFQKVYVPDPSPEYIDCEENTCSGSDSGHDWSNTKLEDEGRNMYYLLHCSKCDGSSKDWFRYKRNDYADDDDNIIHSESV